MTRAGVLALAGLGLGFLVGFLWGQESRGALSEATSTDVSGGVVTVRVDVLRAAKDGARNLIGGITL